MSQSLPNDTLFPSFGKVDDLYPLGLDIPKENKKELKPEIEIIPTVPKHIYYNFYPILSKKIYTLFSGSIQYQLPGKENEPNIVFNEGSQYTTYSSQKLYIFSKIHETNADGELVVEHRPITNSEKKLFVCFLLKTDYLPAITHSKPVLEKLIEHDTTEGPTEIDLNAIIPTEDECIYYETPTAKVIVFQTPLRVSAHFTGFTQGELYELQTKPREIQRIRASSNYSSQNALKPSSNTVTGWNIFENKEGFIEGNEEDVKWMECDNVPLDYSEEIPTYQVMAGSVTKDFQSQLFGATINIIWMVSIVVILIFVLPSLYTLLVKMGIGSANSYDEVLNLIRNFEFTWILVLVVPALIMIFAGASNIALCNTSLTDLNNSDISSENKNMEKLKRCLVTPPPVATKIGDDPTIWPNTLINTDYLNNAVLNVKTKLNSSVQTAIIGGLLLGLWFICFVIMCFYKVLSPDFMHLDADFKFQDKLGKKTLAFPMPSGGLFTFWINIFTKGIRVSPTAKPYDSKVDQEIQRIDKETAT